MYRPVEIKYDDILDSDISYNPCGEIPLYPTVQCPTCKKYRTEVWHTSSYHGDKQLICNACKRDKQIDTICQ